MSTKELIDRLTQTETRPARRVPPSSGGTQSEVKAPDPGGVETRIGAGVIRRRRSGGEEVRIETKPPVLGRAPVEPPAPEAELPKAKAKRPKKSAEAEAVEAAPEATPAPQETARATDDSAAAAQEKKKAKGKKKKGISTHISRPLTPLRHPLDCPAQVVGSAGDDEERQHAEPSALYILALVRLK